MRGVEPQAQDWFHQQTGVYESPRPTPDFGTKCPELVDTLTTKQTDFPLKIEMGGKHFRAFPLDYPLAKTGGAVNGGAFVRRSS